MPLLNIGLLSLALLLSFKIEFHLHLQTSPLSYYQQQYFVFLMAACVKSYLTFLL